MIERQAQAVLTLCQRDLGQILARNKALAVLRRREPAVFIKSGNQQLMFLKTAAVADVGDRRPRVAQ